MGERSEDREARSASVPLVASPLSRRGPRKRGGGHATRAAPTLHQGTVLAAVVLVSALPLAFDPGGFQIFLPIKWMIAAGAIPLGLAFAVRREGRLPEVRMMWAWGALISILVVASFVGVAPMVGLIGSAGRNLGVLAWILFAGSFILGAVIGRHRPSARLIALIAVGTMIPVSLYGLAQWAGMDPLSWQEGIDLSRARSTFGNAAFLGAYLVLLIPVASMMGLDQELSPRWRVMSAIASVGGMSALLATGTRGAWIGMAVAAVIVAVSQRRRMNIGRGGLFALGAGIIGLVVIVAATPVGERARSIVDIGEGTARGRLLTWSRTAGLIAERPLLGWGPDTFGLVFPKAIDAQYEREVGRTTVPDRAHNVFLDLAATSGLAGAAALAFLVFLVLQNCVKALSLDTVHVGGAAGVVGYLTQQQFSFPLADLDTLWWLFAGMVVVRAGSAPGPQLPRVLRPILLSIFVAAIAWTVRDVAADHLLRDALEKEAAGRADEALADMALARSLAPERGQYFQASARMRRRLAEDGGPPELFNEAIRDLDLAKRRVPSLEFELDRGDVFLAWGEATGDRGKVKTAEGIYRSLLDADPNSARALLKFGVCLAHDGRLQEAEDAWTTASYLSPRSVGPRLNLALLYERLGMQDKAASLYREVLKIDPDHDSARSALSRISSLPG